MLQYRGATVHWDATVPEVLQLCRHTKLVAYERELIGLVQAVKHWRAYLWGARLW
jgi:hypothetical protein